MKKKFNPRGFLSLYIALSFLIMTISGIILFLSPAGRVANWSNWRLFGLLKSQWQAVHTIFTFIFVVAITFHLFFNWRPLLAYLKTKIGSTVVLRKEILAASAIAILFFVLTVYNVTPFGSVMAFGESLKDSWSAQNNEPPIPHAEEQTIQKFAETIKISTDDLKNKLASKGIIIDSDSATIKEISKQNNVSPSELYRLVQSATNQPLSAPMEGRGYGRKTIEQICADLKISVGDGLNRLKAKGINADKDEKLKDVASRYMLTPMEVANSISASAD